MTASLAQQLATLDQQRLTALEAAARAVETLPQNPAYSPRKERCGVVSSHAVFARDDWTPFAHDHRHQASVVATLIRRDCLSVVRELAAGRAAEVPDIGRVRLAPAVAQQVAAITGLGQDAAASAAAGKEG